MCRITRRRYTCYHEKRTRLSQCRGTYHKLTKRGYKVVACSASRASPDLIIKSPSLCGPCQFQEWEKPYNQRLERGKHFLRILEEEGLPGEEEIRRMVEEMEEERDRLAWSSKVQFPGRGLKETESPVMHSIIKTPSPLRQELRPEDIEETVTKVNEWGTSSWTQNFSWSPTDYSATISPDIDAFPPVADAPDTYEHDYAHSKVPPEYPTDPSSTNPSSELHQKPTNNHSSKTPEPESEYPSNPNGPNNNTNPFSPWDPTPLPSTNPAPNPQNPTNNHTDPNPATLEIISLFTSLVLSRTPETPKPPATIKPNLHPLLSCLPSTSESHQQASTEETPPPPLSSQNPEKPTQKLRFEQRYAGRSPGQHLQVQRYAIRMLVKREGLD